MYFNITVLSILKGIKDKIKNFGRGLKKKEIAHLKKNQVKNINLK